MSKHNGYMIDGVRLSKRSREALMRLVVKFHSGMSSLHQELVLEHEESQRHRQDAAAAKNRLDVAVEAAGNIRIQKRELERSLEEVRGQRDRMQDLATTRMYKIDELEERASVGNATVADLRLKLEAANALKNKRSMHARRWFWISAVLALSLVGVLLW